MLGDTTKLPFSHAEKASFVLGYMRTALQDAAKVAADEKVLHGWLETLKTTNDDMKSCLGCSIDMQMIFEQQIARLLKQSGVRGRYARHMKAWFALLMEIVNGFNVERIGPILFNYREHMPDLRGCFKEKAEKSRFHDVFDIISSKCHEESSKVVVCQSTQFAAQNLTSQSFWSCSQEDSRTKLFPFMAKTSEEADTEDAQSLFMKFKNESSGDAKSALQNVAGFSRPEETSTKFMAAATTMHATTTGRLDLVYKLTLRVELLRVAGAKFLLARGEEERSVESWLAEKTKDVPCERFVPKPTLSEAMAKFYDVFTQQQLLEQELAAAEPAMPADSLADFQALLKDAKELYEEKTGTLFSGLASAVDRIVSNLKDVLVPWRDFAGETEDVQRIKDELINNPLRPLLNPTLKQIAAAIQTAKSLLRCAPTGELTATLARSIQDGEEYEQAGKDQMAAGALCVALYVTGAGNGKASSKAKALREAKRAVNALGPKAKMPAEMMSRIQGAIQKFDADVAAEKKSK